MTFDELLNLSSDSMPAIAVCKAADEDVLKPLVQLHNETEMVFHLVDDETLLNQLLESFSGELLNSSRVVLHHASSDEDAARISCELVARGEAQMLMKGMVATATILKEVLNKAHGLVQQKVLSHVALFDLPHYHKAVLVTDCAMNIAPDVDAKEAIIENAVNVAHNIGIDIPKVALLSAVEKVNPKIPSTTDADELKNRLHSRNDLSIDGPLQYDLAISKKAVATKGLKSDVAGDADILIAPHLDAGNVLYKSLVYSANSRVAAMIVGAKVPIVLTSRADSSEVKYLSIKLASNSI